MGKTKKSKPRMAKVNPIGIPSVRDIEQNEDFFGEDEMTDGPISALCDQIHSNSIEEKMCGLQALSVMCQNKTRIDEIIETDIVKTIASWLMDSSRSIRNATAGALRNLSVCSVEVSEYIVEQDVLTPLLALLCEYASDLMWTPHLDPVTGEIDDSPTHFCMPSICCGHCARVHRWRWTISINRLAFCRVLCAALTMQILDLTFPLRSPSVCWSSVKIIRPHGEC